MFLILVAVGAGLCSAQTAGKKYYLVGGLFFEGMPPGVGSDNVAAFIIHEDGARHEVTELRLRKGIVLSEEVREYATPADEVPGAEAFLMSYRGGTGKKLPIGGADVVGRPMVLNFWYTGCGPCIREMSELNKWIEVYPDVTYLATTFDSAVQIKKIVESRPFLFTQIADDLFFFETFHVSGMPVTILVDKKGIIRHIEQGTGTAKLRYMQDKLQKLVSE